MGNIGAAQNNSHVKTTVLFNLYIHLKKFLETLITSRLEFRSASSEKAFVKRVDCAGPL